MFVTFNQSKYRVLNALVPFGGDFVTLVSSVVGSRHDFFRNARVNLKRPETSAPELVEPDDLAKNENVIDDDIDENYD